MTTDIPFFTIPFGPCHPSSGHFHASVTVDGERVVNLVPDPGYLHRGFEKLMEYRTYLQNSPLVDRICILDPFAAELGYVNAAEKVLEIEAPERGRFIRTIMAEFGRILSHITWIGVTCMVVGLDSGCKIAWGDREPIIRINEKVTGGRIYPCYFLPGGVRRDAPEGFTGMVEEALSGLEKNLEQYDFLVFNNETFRVRMEDVGFLDAEEAITLGATGPNLRAAGVDADLRKDQPYEVYDQLDFNVVTQEKGDAFARGMCRRMEIEESMNIIRDAVHKMPEGDFKNKSFRPFSKAKKKETYFCCESARGEQCYHMVGDGTDKPYRVKVRGPSFSHTLDEFPYLAKKAYIADIPAIYWSLDPCPADVDR
ncbi:NADH-quinone oxidoreductase subunit D [Candidatus Bathyarchaeota archaeon]|nr:NADH-quinone oxidoreductase subunit D [Candidatus Bathyarchaeota archaeon]